ncbi:GNAT family N-acetyltransferase [Mucilaginibacter pocheonensis]|uniref:GNAT superfamily N-acetyltransferase n=1 Tax=Mucilaginibacter pocheonensis TaxID=398050 RepID=A0ABU1TFX4_9SPHI|nr:GNAT family N-acetyltransferase [Mucilaginibacter pocheonensis]MDR6943740.1 GNAT superfamily N-acetyltransferase [Mucilaginibacter pocheonensis]
MEIKFAKTVGEINFCKEVILGFRPNLEPETFADQILCMMKSEYFKLAYIPDEGGTKAAAFIGYRTLSTLRTGKMIYIDDLYTDEAHRGKGYAGALLDLVTKEAAQIGAPSVQLDSGYMLHDAHRLYLNKGYFLACNHFAKLIA